MSELFSKAAAALDVSPGGLIAMLMILIVGIFAMIMLHHVLKGVQQRADRMTEIAFERYRQSVSGEPINPSDELYDF